ncbi:hypothetical protein BDN72DRAFT_76410 [Pluteus cervinus]|uniref:Uncharacterized protein n=1 Tax=Pluteus cervinus TaxID=181527 RepID=A0ACD3APY7_9AGAR|nr:hypothetical protein BDN72DRAFT_76410 [Pluteus cervinus]
MRMMALICASWTLPVRLPLAVDFTSLDAPLLECPLTLRFELVPTDMLHDFRNFPSVWAKSPYPVTQTLESELIWRAYRREIPRVLACNVIPCWDYISRRDRTRASCQSVSVQINSVVAILRGVSSPRVLHKTKKGLWHLHLSVAADHESPTDLDGFSTIGSTPRKTA